MRYLRYLLLILACFFQLTIESYAELKKGCKEQLQYPPVFFYKAKHPKEPKTNYKYTAEIGNYDLCKKSLDRNLIKVKVNDIEVVSKDEYCKAKNKFWEEGRFWGSMGTKGRKFCENFELDQSLINILYENKESFLSLHPSLWTPKTQPGKDYARDRDKLIEKLFAKTNSSSAKSKLKELKNMLDEGLISQEQYDDKSTKILDEF